MTQRPTTIHDAEAAGEQAWKDGNPLPTFGSPALTTAAYRGYNKGQKAENGVVEASAPSALMNYDTVSLARWAVADALTAAISIAGRASEKFEGTNAYFPFASLRDALSTLRDSGDAMKVLSRLEHSLRDRKDFLMASTDAEINSLVSQVSALNATRGKG